MTIFFKTRSAARLFAQMRTSNGNKTSVVDNGPQAAKRYAANLQPQAK